MSEKLKLPVLIKNPLHYLGLWILLVILSVAILSFPLNVRYEYNPVESVLAIGEMIPFFAAIFYVWFAVLLVLLFFSGERSDWHKLALLIVFALVFGGLWIINTPNGNGTDIFMHLGNIKYLIDNGRIAFDSQNLGYLQFPVLHLLNAAFSLISGVALLKLPEFYLFFSFTLLTALLFLLCKKCTGNSHLATLGVLLIILGSIASGMLDFWPGNPSYLLLVMLLTCLVTIASSKSTSLSVVILILLTVFVMSYLPNPVYFIFILAGMYLLQRLSGKEVINLPTILLFIVLFSAWQIYWASLQFQSFAVWAKNFIDGLLVPKELINSVNSLTTALSTRAPLWTNVTLSFWVILIFVFGGVLGLRNLFKVRKLDATTLIITGGLVGAAGFTVIAAFTFGAQGQWQRFLYIGPLFLIPIILIYLTGVKNKLIVEKYILTGAVMLVLIFSLPTFLLVGRDINTNTVYDYERSTTTFIESVYGEGKIEIYTAEGMKMMYFTFLYNANIFTVMPPDVVYVNAPLWPRMFALADSFGKSENKDAILVLSERFRLPLHNPSAIQPDDPNWLEFVSRIENNDRIYDNGHIQIYQSLAGGTK